MKERVGVLEQHLTDIKQNQNIVLDQLSTLVTKHDYAILGHNGEAGLVRDVDRLKQINITDTLREIKKSLKDLEIRAAWWAGGLAVIAFAAPQIMKLVWP